MSKNRKNTQVKMKEEIIALPAGVTAADIETWKSQYGEDSLVVISVQVTDKDVAQAVLVKPNCLPDTKARGCYERAFQLFQSEGALKAGEFIINNCWLGGDTRLKGAGYKTIDIMASAAMKAVQMVSFFETTISAV